MHALDERVTKEISNVRLDKQGRNLDTSTGMASSYDKLKTRFRKLEDKFNVLEQRTTTEKSLYRLLDSNTKYTRELNDEVNSWKRQSEKEQRLLKAQLSSLEERASSMEKLIQTQQTFIADLASQLQSKG